MVEALFSSWPLIILSCILISYALFTLTLTLLWKKIPNTFTNEIKADLKISVIIPVRNEAENIRALLADLDRQTLPYAHFEVLVTDDSSTDNTREIVRQFALESKCNIHLISLADEPTKSPKKRAIEGALQIAKGELIITTDGDCRVGGQWLERFAHCYATTNAKLISGPVTFLEESSITDHLQTVEFSSLIGSGASAISAGYPSLCNGANLAYQKTAFMEVGGFDGVRHIASGDDEFLMHKIAAKFPGCIHFIKDPQAIVRTKAHQDWSLFFRQRKRWASKWKHYQSKTPLALALYIFTSNLCLILALTLYLTGNISLNSVLSLWLTKCAPEWIFIGSVLTFLKKSRSIPYILITQIIYPFYVCFFGLAVQKPDYEWKGRKLV